MNVGMEIALLPLDTRGQAEAQTVSLECGERGESTWSGPCFESLLYCHTALPSLLHARVMSVKVCHPMICGQRQLCKAVGRVRSAPSDLSIFSVSC